MPRGLTVLPILPADRAAVRSFFRAAAWQYCPFDSSLANALTLPGYRALDEAGNLVGVLGCCLDRPSVASLQYAAVDSRERPRRVIGALLPPSESHMQQEGATELTFVGWAPWLADCLETLGFVLRTTVISYQRWGWEAPASGNPSVDLRPATAADADRLADLDAAAFDPMWRYARSMHSRLIRDVAHCVIAESAGAAVGYGASDVLRSQGHIIRLAVHPTRQGQGVGTRILSDAIRFFRERGVEGIMINTQADNGAACRLYEGFGFTRFGEVVPALCKPLERSRRSHQAG